MTWLALLSADGVRGVPPGGAHDAGAFGAGLALEDVHLAPALSDGRGSCRLRDADAGDGTGSNGGAGGRLFGQLADPAPTAWSRGMCGVRLAAPARAQPLHSAAHGVAGVAGVDSRGAPSPEGWLPQHGRRRAGSPPGLLLVGARGGKGGVERRRRHEVVRLGLGLERRARRRALSVLLLRRRRHHLWAGQDRAWRVRDQPRRHVLPETQRCAIILTGSCVVQVSDQVALL